MIDGDGSLNVWGIDENHQSSNETLITVDITSYDPANPCITTEHATSTSTTASSVGGGKVDQNQQNPSSTEEEPIANAENYLIGAVIILGVVVLALFITVLVMAMVIHGMKQKLTRIKDSNIGCVEKGHTSDCYAMQAGHKKSGTDQMQSTAHDMESKDQAQGDAAQVDVDVQSTAPLETEDQTHSGDAARVDVDVQSKAHVETEDQTHSPAHGHEDQIDVDSDGSMDNSTTNT